MRKLTMLLTAAAVLAGPAVVQGQVTGSVNVSAKVYTPLSVTPSGSVDLGMALQGTATTLTVDPKTGGTKAGAFVVAGQKNAGITVTEPTTATLTLQGGSATLTFNANWADGTTSTQTSSTIQNAGSVTLNSSGNWYFWLGGSVTTTASAPASTETGTYQGTVTLSVAYP